MADVQHYLAHIAAYEREFAKWEKRADKILKDYRDDQAERRKGAKFNVLWSNVQTLKAATFARMPQPDVSRRFKDDDPIGRVAALMLERALEFEVQHYEDFGAVLRQCVYDRFLAGRGVAWVRYEPTFQQIEAGAPEDGPTLTEDAKTETKTAEELAFECAPVDYVHWRDFGHNVARTWEEVTIVWRKVYMTRPALERHFGDDAKDIPLDATPEEFSKLKGSTDSDSVQKRALIFEIWDKDTGECVFLSKSVSKIIRAIPDPLELEEFFPCPPPLYATLTTDSLVPLPDFTLYQDQARELDLLSDRIDGLVDALQVRGVYDASVPALARLFKESGNGDLIPVDNWAGFVEKQGLKGAVDLVDILPLAQALAEAYKAFEQIKGQIYELTGISDIIRGETAPSETATAQQIKNNYASMRLKTYQDEVERFATRLLRLKAQIICKRFDAKTICQISGCEQLSQADQRMVPQAVQMLQSDVTRIFRIEVATDSMVFQDEQQDKQDRMEFLQAVSQFMEKAVQAGQAAPQVAPLAIELLKFGVRGFRVGKNIEGTIDQVADQLKQVALRQAQNPQPNPEMVKAQAQMQQTQLQEQNKAQMQQAQMQADQAADQARAQADIAIAQAKAQADVRLEAQRQQHEAAMQLMQQRHDQAMAAFQQQHDASMQGINQTLQLLLQRMKGETAVEVAEISAQTTLDAAQISAAKQGDSQ
jgi:hypothetical protein